MKRKIITIDEDLCNGCGECISACAEGALQLVDGKAKLVKEQFCDGFGDCLGECPTGALKIVEQDVPQYDPTVTREHVLKTGGQEAVKIFDAAAQRHEAHSGGCPGMAMRFNPKAGSTPKPARASGPGQAIRSELEQWPVQIHLVRPDAPYFKNRELVILSTCSPIASADIHWRFIRGRSVVVGCPKLDNTDGYSEKLAAILSEPTIPKVIVVRMEVPCCGGLTAIVRQAVEASGRNNLEFEEVTVSLDGNIAVP
jgi:ferredoxin